MPTIEEIPTGKGAAPAPGWAYVADTGFDPSRAAINPSGSRGKRAVRNVPAIGGGVVASARQERAVQQRLTDLDRDVPTREVPIPPTFKSSRGMKAVQPSSHSSPADKRQ